MIKTMIGFCGYARVGKDTAAKELARQAYDHSFAQIGFADELKKDLEQCIVWCKSYGIDINSPEFKERFRPMWVEWSRVAKAVAQDKLVWVKRADIIAKKIQAKNTIPAFCDVRYDYEIDYICENGGEVVFIKRPGIGPRNKEEADSFKIIDERFAGLQKTNTILNDATIEILGENVFNMLVNRGFFDRIDRP